MVTLPALAVAGGVGIASPTPGAVLIGSLMLLATPVLGFVPVRWTQRRWRLRRLTRRWAAQRVARSAVGPRWQPALDALAAAERSLRAAGLHEHAGTAADALGLSLDRAAAGTDVEAEITRITAAVDAGDPTDPDVAVLRSDLLRAAQTRDVLVAANRAAADRMTHLAATAGSAAAAGALRSPPSANGPSANSATLSPEPTHSGPQTPTFREEEKTVARLAVVRGQGGIGTFRNMIVTVDDQRIGQLLTGNRVVVQVAAGPHRVRARMDWARSEELSVQVTDIEVSEVEVTFPVASGLMATFLRPSRAITLRQRR